MPFDVDEVRVDLICSRREGRSRGWFTIKIRPEVLRPLGLHPDQPSSRVVGPVQPGWWRAEAMRRFGCRKGFKLTWTTLSGSDGTGPRFGEPRPDRLDRSDRSDRPSRPAGPSP